MAVVVTVVIHCLCHLLVASAYCSPAAIQWFALSGLVILVCIVCFRSRTIAFGVSAVHDGFRFVDGVVMACGAFLPPFIATTSGCQAGQCKLDSRLVVVHSHRLVTFVRPVFKFS